jgi:hypothetical protein
LGGQGALWAYCWDHWTQDVYSVEFCEHGVLTCEKLFLWSKISRIGWSPATPKHLTILAGGFHRALPIADEYRSQVDDFLHNRAAAANDPLQSA